MEKFKKEEFSSSDGAVWNRIKVIPYVSQWNKLEVKSKLHKIETPTLIKSAPPSERIIHSSQIGQLCPIETPDN